VEPQIFETWDRACKEQGYRLRCAMDPWSALASCLPDGNHLLVHGLRVMLATITDRKVMVFKTWRRPPGSAPESLEWIDEVLQSLEWADTKGEVRLWDLHGKLEVEAVAEKIARRSGMTVIPAPMPEAGEFEPWCKLLASPSREPPRVNSKGAPAGEKPRSGSASHRSDSRKVSRLPGSCPGGIGRWRGKVTTSSQSTITSRPPPGLGQDLSLPPRPAGPFQQAETFPRPTLRPTLASGCSQMMWGIGFHQ